MHQWLLGQLKSLSACEEYISDEKWLVILINVSAAQSAYSEKQCWKI